MSTSLIVQGVDETTPGRYLCVQMGGMNELIETLVGLDMAFASKAPYFPWEEFEDLEGDPSHYDEHGVPVSPRARRLTEHVKEARRAHVELGTPGIPAHKLWVWEGYDWHVTRQECEDAVAVYDEAIAAGAEHPETFEDEVIPFLRLAAQCDGFRVT